MNRFVIALAVTLALPAAADDLVTCKRTVTADGFLLDCKSSVIVIPAPTLPPTPPQPTTPSDTATPCPPLLNPTTCAWLGYGNPTAGPTTPSSGAIGGNAFDPSNPGHYLILRCPATATYTPLRDGKLSFSNGEVPGDAGGTVTLTISGPGVYRQETRNASYASDENEPTPVKAGATYTASLTGGACVQTLRAQLQ